MSPHTPDLGDQKLTNFHYLRLLCIQQMRREPNAEWSPSELEALGELLAETAGELALQRKLVNDDWRENAGLLIINRDLDDLTVTLPKWAALASWLSPESAASHVPELVSKIAKLALSGKLGTSRERGGASTS